MQLFQTMLVAADFSERSREAFRVASALADERTTRMIVLHIIEKAPVAERAIGFDERGVVVALGEDSSPRTAALHERLREVYAPGRPIDVSYETREGAAAEEILRRAQEVNADLIVLGTQGRTGLSRLLAGSVAETVLRQAPCPVLALHAAPRTGGAEAIQVILHPTDFSEQSAAALAVARELARMHGARLILLHVAPILGAIALEAPVTLGDPEAYRQALDDLRQRTDGPDLKYPVEIQLEQGEAAPLTIRAAEKLGCSLIVLGTHGRTGLGRVLMGSVAEAILRGAPCPVLALKGRQAERAEAAPAAAQPASKSVLII